MKTLIVYEFLKFLNMVNFPAKKEKLQQIQVFSALRPVILSDSLLSTVCENLVANCIEGQTIRVETRVDEEICGANQDFEEEFENFKMLSQFEHFLVLSKRVRSQERTVTAVDTDGLLSLIFLKKIFLQVLNIFPEERLRVRSQIKRRLGQFIAAQIGCLVGKGDISKAFFGLVRFKAYFHFFQKSFLDKDFGQAISGVCSKIFLEHKEVFTHFILECFKISILFQVFVSNLDKKGLQRPLNLSQNLVKNRLCLSTIEMFAKFANTISKLKGLFKKDTGEDLSMGRIQSMLSREQIEDTLKDWSKPSAFKTRVIQNTYLMIFRSIILKTKIGLKILVPNIMKFAMIENISNMLNQKLFQEDDFGINKKLYLLPSNKEQEMKIRQEFMNSMFEEIKQLNLDLLDSQYDMFSILNDKKVPIIVDSYQVKKSSRGGGAQILITTLKHFLISKYLVQKTPFLSYKRSPLYFFADLENHVSWKVEMEPKKSYKLQPHIGDCEILVKMSGKSYRKMCGVGSPPANFYVRNQLVVEKFTGSFLLLLFEERKLTLSLVFGLFNEGIFDVLAFLKYLKCRSIIKFEDLDDTHLLPNFEQSKCESTDFNRLLKKLKEDPDFGDQIIVQFSEEFFLELSRYNQPYRELKIETPIFYKLEIDWQRIEMNKSLLALGIPKLKKKKESKQSESDFEKRENVTLDMKGRG